MFKGLSNQQPSLLISPILTTGLEKSLIHWSTKNMRLSAVANKMHSVLISNLKFKLLHHSQF